MIGLTVNCQFAGDVITIFPPVLVSVSVAVSDAGSRKIIRTLISGSARTVPLDDRLTEMPSHVLPRTIGGSGICAGRAMVKIYQEQ